MYVDNYTSRCKIMERVPPGSKVLEIGCGDGRLANILTIKKNCRFYCVDKDPVMVAIARKKCVEIHNIDIEISDIPYEAGFFDVIILENVLEHLKEPQEVLKRLKKYLSEKGSLIYSVPNILNWHSRLTIFSGKFRYEESGVFDRDHLRFYDLDSAKDLATDAGYRIVWIDVTPSVYMFKERVNFLWYGLAVIWKNLFADEFIIEGRKG
ncbi:MAG: class I SAM-dependent methyltransferase [Candidatus Methanoperedens sp.]|nr:class I SAM-dependent methyltransferase [Candidatus Methanoperedens sp.]